LNVLAVLGLLVKDETITVDLEDEVLDGCAVVFNGDIRNEAARAAVQGGV